MVLINILDWNPKAKLSAQTVVKDLDRQGNLLDPDLRQQARDFGKALVAITETKTRSLYQGSATQYVNSKKRLNHRPFTEAFHGEQLIDAINKSDFLKVRDLVVRFPELFRYDPSVEFESSVENKYLYQALTLLPAYASIEEAQDPKLREKNLIVDFLIRKLSELQNFFVIGPYGYRDGASDAMKLAVNRLRVDLVKNILDHGYSSEENALEQNAYWYLNDLISKKLDVNNLRQVEVCFAILKNLLVTRNINLSQADLDFYPGFYKNKFKEQDHHRIDEIYTQREAKRQSRRWLYA